MTGNDGDDRGRTICLIYTGGSSNAGTEFSLWVTRSARALNPRHRVVAVADGVGRLATRPCVLESLDDSDFSGMISIGQNLPAFDRAPKLGKDGEHASERPTVARKLRDAGVDLVIWGGGNGSSGLYAAMRPHLAECGIRSAFVGMTIDADMEFYGPEVIGCSTAVTEITRHVDGLRSYFRSNHGRRLFLNTCFGRASGYLALNACANAGSRSFLLREEIVHVPETAVLDRAELGVEAPDRVSLEDLVLWWILSHLKTSTIAETPDKQRMLCFVAEGVWSWLDTSGEAAVRLGREMAGRMGVDSDFHNGMAQVLSTYEVCRDQRADANDAALAREYAIALTEALLIDPSADDLVALRRDGSVGVVRRTELLGGDRPFAEVGLDLASDPLYARMRRVRSAWMLNPGDAHDGSLLDGIAERTRHLSREELEAAVRRVGFLGSAGPA